MTGDQQIDDEWKACPQGELAQMVARLDAAQRRAKTRRLYQVGAMSMLLFAGGVLAVGSLVGLGEPKYGGIRCSECKSQFAAYHAHVTDAEAIADATLVASMATHLDRCRLCRERFEQAYPGVLDSGLSAATHPAVRIKLPLIAAAESWPIY